jgi:hypothetical protein
MDTKLRIELVAAFVLFSMIGASSGANADELEPGDTLLSINGKQVNSENEFARAVTGSPGLMRFTIINRRTRCLCPLETQLRPKDQDRRLGVTAAEQRGEGLKIREVQQGSPATKCEVDSDLEFARTIAKMIMDGQGEHAEKLPNGSVIVYQWPTEDITQPGVAKYVWEVKQGKLERAEYTVYQRAFAARRSGWPPSTMCFAISSQDHERAVVNISSFYDQGLGPDSRGGYAIEWTLKHDGEQWTLKSQQDAAAWD